MFDKEFYPTPNTVIKRMLNQTKIGRDTFILEPSAGKGDILDYISKNHHYDRPKLYAIEKNPELRMILNEKHYKVIGDDFLEYNSDMHFDYILMNPPFSNGDEHLLHAWDILHTGKIICLLNTATIQNPHTKRRKQLLELIAENGEVWHLDKAFDTAERKTNVDVSMVVLNKIGEDRFNFDIKYDKEKKTTLNEETLNNKIATKDVIENLVTFYDSSKETVKDFLKSYQKIKFYTDPLIKKLYQEERDLLIETLKHDDLNCSYNYFIEELKRKAWSKVLEQPSINKFVTTSVREDLSEFIRQKGDMDFTKRNIQNIITELMLNKENIFFKCVTDTFEKMCSFDKDNKVHIEGWKTNSAYKANKRVIMPYFVEHYNYGRESFRVDYRRGFNLEDIDKAMCLIDGRDFEYIVTIRDALQKQFRIIESGKYRNGTNNKCESEYFNIKFYKKGTLHLQFKDDKVWEQFNVVAAQGKNWIGTDDMSEYKELLQLR